ncbi:MAG: DNA polymerase IV [Thermoleophilia bacterium]
MPAAATILHADLDAFYASVEQRDDPALRGRPVIVGGGVVVAASYEARARGVHSAMGGGRARRLCPDAVVVEPRWPAYVEASRAVFEIFARTAPLVEGLSIDEAFLDVRGMERIAGTPAAIAAGLRREVRDRVGLPITVGVATTKHLAKVASAAAKPDGLLVVRPGEELAFLHPLPVERLWGVGRVTSGRLRAHGLATVGDVAALEEGRLVALLGGHAGRHLHAVANNRDPRAIVARRRRRTFGAQSALGRGGASAAEVDAIAAGLADRVARRMRAAGRAGRTVTLRLRFGDYSRATRGRTLPQATSATGPILMALRGLIEAERATIARRGITLVGLAVSNLADPGGEQLALPLLDPGRAALDAALDEVRERFGPTAVTRASLAGRDPGLAAWLMPGEGHERSAEA